MKFLANLKSNTFHIKLLWLLFGQLLKKIGLLFNLASGHPESLDILTYFLTVSFEDECPPPVGFSWLSSMVLSRPTLSKMYFLSSAIVLMWMIESCNRIGGLVLKVETIYLGLKMNWLDECVCTFYSDNWFLFYGQHYQTFFFNLSCCRYLKILCRRKNWAINMNLYRWNFV